MHCKSWTFLCAATFAASLCACGSNSNLGGAASANSADAHAAQQSAQAADDGGSADSVVGRGGAAFFLAQAFVPEAARAIDANVSTTFVLGGCTGAVNATADLTAGTVNANVSFDGNCTGKRSVSGTENIVLKYATASDANRNLTVTENLTWTLADGDTVKVTSLGEGPTATVAADSTTADSNVRLAVTLNEHRVRASGDGNAVFDMNITTADGKPLIITNTYGASMERPRARIIASGTLAVHHNLAKFNATHDFENVARSLDGSCACPESGTLVQTVVKDDKSGGFVRTYTFTGCGQASVVTTASTLHGTSNGTAQVTWNDCQN